MLIETTAHVSFLLSYDNHGRKKPIKQINVNVMTSFGYTLYRAGYVILNVILQQSIKR